MASDRLQVASCVSLGKDVPTLSQPAFSRSLPALVLQVAKEQVKDMIFPNLLKEQVNLTERTGYIQVTKTSGAGLHMRLVTRHDDPSVSC